MFEIDQKLMDSVFNNVFVEPRPYQYRLIDKTVRAFEGRLTNQFGHTPRPAESVLLQAPTGSGKTVMGLGVTKYLQEQRGCKRIGWTAMHRDLLQQAKRENFARNFGTKIEWISMFDRNPPEHLDALVYDECHHEASMTARRFWECSKPKFTFGLTATPVRADNMALAFQALINDVGIQELILDGYLSKFDHFQIHSWTPEHVAEVFLRWRTQWGKSVVFFLTEEECVQFQRLVRAGGVNCELVTCDTDRETQLNLFRDDGVQVLVNMRILTEGFDEPSLKSVFVRDSSKWPAIQMAGRVLRSFPGIERKQIVQSGNTHFNFCKYATPKSSYLLREGSRWLSLTTNPHLDSIFATMAKALVHSESPDIPEYFSKSLAERTKHSTLMDFLPKNPKKRKRRRSHLNDQPEMPDE